MFKNHFINHAINASAETAEDRVKLTDLVAEAATDAPAATTAEEGSSILNFALNLEYLEAEFHLRDATGQGLPDDMVGGVGTLGQVSGGRQVDFRSPSIKNIAREIAMDERAHVAFLRGAPGNGAVARPRISLDHSFTAAAVAAGLIKPGEIFDAYANGRNFLFAAFLFEDVGVTAFKGVAPFISNKTYLDAAVGLPATEAYHAGIVRASLFNEGLVDDSVFDVVHNISPVRNAVSGPAEDDRDLGTKDAANLAPTDEYGRAFGRSAAEILNIVYLDAQGGTSGGFYPDGLNGDIVHGTGPTAD